MGYKIFFSMPWRHWVLGFLTGFACNSVMAQWQWVDGTGRKVFSDTAPPISVPEKSILKRPGLHPNTSAIGTNPPAIANNAAASLDTSAAPKLSGRDDQLETRKKQAEEAEQAKKKAEEERQAKVRAENCERAKRAKATLDSGIRIATTNAKGEREILDDAGRVTEAKRLEDIIRSECSTKVN